MAWILRGLLGLVCVALLGWMALALYLSPLAPPSLRAPLAAVVPIAAIAALVWVRPLWRVAALVGGAFILVALGYFSIEASQDRDWQPDVAMLPHAEIDGDRVVVHNVRNADYRSETDFTVHFEDRELDLSRLRSMDLFLIHWGSPAIAHTIMSWGFEGDDYLAISIETRKEKGEEYSAVKGFFRQYELYYVVSDERDVVRLRSNYRGEDVAVYRLDVPVEGARMLLLRYLDAVNHLHETPEWYNALVHNCTTTIQHLAGPLEQRNWWSWKLFLNGYLDELAYEIGAIDQSMPFAELKALSHINKRAQAADADPRFSVRIREGLPRMSESPGT